MPKFYWNLKGGTKVKFNPHLEFLRNLRENLIGGTKGYFDLSWEKSQRGDQRIIWLESRKTSKGGQKETFLNLVQKFSLVPPLRFFSTQVKISFGPPLRFSLEFLKKSWGGSSFTLVPPLRFFPKNFFQGGGYTLPTPPLGEPWL